MKFTIITLVLLLVIFSITNKIFSQTFTDDIYKKYYQDRNIKILEEADMSFSITTPQTTYIPSEPIKINIGVKNKTNTRKLFINSHIFIKVINRTLPHIILRPLRKNYDIYHLYQTGRWSPPPVFSSDFILQANKEIVFSSVNINLLYDMTLSGTYYINISKDLTCVLDNDTNKLAKNSTGVTITIKENTTDLSKIIPSDVCGIYSKPSSGVSISLVSDKQHYDNYGPVYLRVTTKNVSKDSVSMIVDTKNVLDVYELTLLMPGNNLDFRKPDNKNKSDVQKVDYTLYGKKLLAEKSKTPKQTTQVKPNEETAESVIVLNRIFDMSTDGIYGLIVTRKIIDSAGKEQTISSEPLPIRIGQRMTQDEINEQSLQRKLTGYDPDYPTWESHDGLFKVIAKFISVDKDTVILEKPDGKRTTFNISDLTAENKNYIKEQTQKNSNVNSNNHILPKKYNQ
jgi:hypothetical protein